MLQSKKKSLALAAGAALLVSACSSSQSTVDLADNSLAQSDEDMGQCHGKNACKGSGSCATANNNCAGENTCKGKGWLPLSQGECKSQGGKFLGFKKR